MSEHLALWVVIASNDTNGEITYVYARNEGHARELVQGWLEKRSHLPNHEFTTFPNGFQIVRTRLPGHIPMAEEVSIVENQRQQDAP